ncbi:MAG: gliding motility-associated C-terminal domain-containing protein [Prevotella sp.]|nr:gliding motility-associated C-terminal domain-containing protein [Prevotella sp.]
MKKRLFFSLIMAYFATFSVFAYFTPTAYYVVDGEMRETTDMIVDEQAPLEVTFKANPTDEPDDIVYEWRFSRNDESQPYVTRHEENTVFVFDESGRFTVSLFVHSSKDEGAEPVATITVSIADSFLEMPNAFSPNGDGINDIYKAKANHKSIVEFHAYIFNRWGKKIFEWTDINSGWDGTFHGKQVNDGTYYVMVKARGADGIVYNIKRDVNILRKYTEVE